MSFAKTHAKPVFALIGLLLIVSVVDMTEYKFVKSQRMSAYLAGQDPCQYDYSIMNCLNGFFQHGSTIMFYLSTYFVLKPLQKVAKTDVEFAFIFILARWIISVFPSQLIKTFLIEGRFNFNNLPISLFITKEMITQFIIFIFVTAFINFFRFIAQTFGKISSNDLLIEIEESDSYDTGYDLSSTCKSQSSIISEAKGFHITTIFTITIIISLLLSMFLINRIENAYLVNSTTPPDAKLMTSLLQIWDMHQIAYPDIKVHIESGISNHLKVGFYGLFRRKILISDNVVNYLENRQLNAILINCYYRSHSQEGILIAITYLVEISCIPYLIGVITRSEQRSSLRLRNYLSSIIPYLIIYMLPIHFLFNIVRFTIQKQMIFNSDIFAMNLVQPIADAIVKVAHLNKETTVHSKLYAFINLEEPTLEQRLVNLAIAQSRHL